MASIRKEFSSGKAESRCTDANNSEKARYYGAAFIVVSHKIKGERYNAQTDCSLIIAEYKRRAAAVQRISERALNKFMESVPETEREEKYGGINIYNKRKYANPELNALMERLTEKISRRIFSWQLEAKPHANDILVASNLSLIVPDLENEHLSKLYDTVSARASSAEIPKSRSLPRLEFFTASLFKDEDKIHYDSANWGRIADIKRIAYLEESIKLRRGVCKEMALTLYLMLEKDGFDGISLCLLMDKNSYYDHMVVRVKMDGQIYFADPVTGKIMQNLGEFNDYFLADFYEAPSTIMVNSLNNALRK